MKGFLFIDKEKGMTSFDVVRQIRRMTGEKKVGHSGTLDPFATGLLIVALSEATKLLQYLIGFDKEYEALAEFGKISDTYDVDGKIMATPSLKKMAMPTKEEIQKIIAANFLGEISQIPPQYSALKISGKRACDIVRAGGEVDLKPRKITIYSFDVIEYDWPFVRFQIKCSSGTYIRSLIHDLGEKLLWGAYVKELRRNYIDGFKLSQSCKLEDLSNNIEQKLVPIEEIAAKFPCFVFNDAEFKDLANGKILNKKIDLDCLVFALHKEKVVGILEKAPGIANDANVANGADNAGIKIKKLIL